MTQDGCREAVPVNPSPDDAITAKRARILAWCNAGKRIGYALYGLAMVLFFLGLATTYSTWLVTTIVVAMGVGAVLLIPAIILGYGVKAAEREERGEPFRY
jgi:hypothetical protein